MLKSILAVVVGYAIFAGSGFALFQLTGQPPHGEAPLVFMLGAIAYGVAFALLGGYISGWIAGRRPFVHAAVVAAVLALGATVSLVASVPPTAASTTAGAIGLITGPLNNTSSVSPVSAVPAIVTVAGASPGALKMLKLPTGPD